MNIHHYRFDLLPHMHQTVDYGWSIPHDHPMHQQVLLEQWEGGIEQYLIENSHTSRYVFRVNVDHAASFRKWIKRIPNTTISAQWKRRAQLDQYTRIVPSMLELDITNAVRRITTVADVLRFVPYCWHYDQEQFPQSWFRLYAELDVLNYLPGMQIKNNLAIVYVPSYAHTKLKTERYFARMHLYYRQTCLAPGRWQSLYQQETYALPPIMKTPKKIIKKAPKSQDKAEKALSSERVKTIQNRELRAPTGQRGTTRATPNGPIFPS